MSCGESSDVRDRAACAGGGAPASRARASRRAARAAVSPGRAAARSRARSAHLDVADEVGRELGRWSAAPAATSRPPRPPPGGRARIISAIASSSVMPCACTRASRIALMVIRSCILSCCIRSASARPSSDAVAGVDHQLLGVDRPALDERAAPQRLAHRHRSACVAAVVRQLQDVARHRLVHRQVVQHVRVVLAVERLHPLRGPVRRGRRRPRSRSAATRSRAGRAGRSRRPRRRGGSPASR